MASSAFDITTQDAQAMPYEQDPVAQHRLYRDIH
jgi:hypothetical protein